MSEEKNQKKQEIPTLQQLEDELSRERYQSRFLRILRSTIYSLITVAAVAVLGVRMGIAAIDRFIGIYQNHFFRLISSRFCMATSRGRLYR